MPSFICADAFNKMLPFCTGFAAGCMIWMVVAEVLPDAFKVNGRMELDSFHPTMEWNLKFQFQFHKILNEKYLNGFFLSYFYRKHLHLMLHQQPLFQLPPWKLLEPCSKISASITSKLLFLNYFEFNFFF